MTRKKRIAVIGATGSVGGAVLDICARFSDRFQVIALAANSNKKKLLRLAQKFGASSICLTGASAFSEKDYNCLCGARGLSELATDESADHVVFASSGVSAIAALRDSLIAGKEVSLSNKESIVAAGRWIMPLVKRHNQLRPIDSEHSALWQCIREEPAREVIKVWLTASGGPFEKNSVKDMEAVTPLAALKHPIWPMGTKITIDSATMMNKGIECIEAMALFGLRVNQVDALIHHCSQAHAAALFRDGTMKMLLAPADMRLPAAAALSYPERLPLADSEIGFIPPEKWQLDFSEIDKTKFPCFALALEAGQRQGAYPALLIGADEAAVKAFLEYRIKFTDIYRVVSEVLSRWDGTAPANLEETLELVACGERMADELCKKWRYDR